MSHLSLLHVAFKNILKRLIKNILFFIFYESLMLFNPFTMHFFCIQPILPHYHSSQYISPSPACPPPRSLMQTPMRLSLLSTQRCGFL